MKAAQSTCFVMLMFTAMVAGRLQAQNITLIQQGKHTSIRGLSIVNDSIAWLSGSNGYIATTLNGGKTWRWLQVKGYEKADFRDIEAFSDKEAIIMSSGTPALILKTTDGGIRWQVKYQNTDTAYFFDAMDFADKNHGLVLGDPIKNKFLLMETTDGGETWKHLANEPIALPGEACFAASGTCLRFAGANTYIITGGTNARLIESAVKGSAWNYINLPLTQGKPSAGGFSIALNKDKYIAIGGDYASDKKTDSLVAIYTPQTKIFVLVKNNFLSGFQSCVEHLHDNVFVSTGTPGSNITFDGGKTWKKIDVNSYNVCRKAKTGKLVLFAGNNGYIGIFHL